MVDLDSRLNSLRVNRERRLDFPTPESPINTTVCVCEGCVGGECVCVKGVWVHVWVCGEGGVCV